MINVASTVVDWMYRGSDFVFPIVILDEDGDVVELSATDTAHLQMYYSKTDTSPILSKEASTYYPDIGLAIFTFVPEDTEDLLERSYHVSVYIKDNADNIYPVLTSSLGVVAFNPPVVEEV